MKGREGEKRRDAPMRTEKKGRGGGKEIGAKKKRRVWMRMAMTNQVESPLTR